MRKSVWILITFLLACELLLVSLVAMGREYYVGNLFRDEIYQKRILGVK